MRNQTIPNQYTTSDDMAMSHPFSLAIFTRFHICSYQCLHSMYKYPKKIVIHAGKKMCLQLSGGPAQPPRVLHGS